MVLVILLVNGSIGIGIRHVIRHAMSSNGIRSVILMSNVIVIVIMNVIIIISIKVIIILIVIVINIIANVIIFENKVFQISFNDSHSRHYYSLS